MVPNPEFSPAELAALFEGVLSRCLFPARGTAITCAVSGGADSAALMILGVAARCDVTAIHVDHGLREGSAAEAETVRKLCERVGAVFVSASVEVAEGPNLEARARQARYSVLPADVMTGHTADDQAETMVLNLVRGAGLDGMAGMVHGERRPLLDLRRNETEAVCSTIGYEPIVDPMNGNPRFRRVRVRSEVMPLLGDIASRDVTAVLARQAKLFADEAALLETLAADLDATDARAIAAANPVLARRAIRAFLQDGLGSGHPPDSGAVGRVLAVARGEAVGTDVGSGWRVQRTEQRLRLIAPIE